MSSAFITQVFSTLSRPLQWWVVVAPWERGIRIRAGKRAKLLVPGLHFRVPFLDRVYVQTVRLRAIAEDGQTTTTRDGHVLTVGLALQFSIEDVMRLYESIAFPEQTLLARAQALVTEYARDHDRDAMTPAGMEAYVTEGLPGPEWGLSAPRAFVVTYAFVRTFRLIQYGQRSTTGLDDMERKEMESRGAGR